MSNESPRFRQNRGYESPLHEYRCKRGFTINQLMLRADCTQNVISSLANGMMAPVYTRNRKGHEKGKLRKEVVKIAEVLQVSIEELFPRYFCAVDISRLYSDQIIDILQAEPRRDPLDIVICQQQTMYLCGACKLLPKQQYRLLYCRFWLGYSLKQCGIVLGVTKERVRQLQNKALRALRYKVDVARCNY